MKKLILIPLLCSSTTIYADRFCDNVNKVLNAANHNYNTIKDKTLDYGEDSFGIQEWSPTIHLIGECSVVKFNKKTDYRCYVKNINYASMFAQTQEIKQKINKCVKGNILVNHEFNKHFTDAEFITKNNKFIANIYSNEKGYRTVISFPAI